MALIEYGPQDMYITEDNGVPKNIYDFLKRLNFPQGCEIVLVRNGLAECYKNTEAMPEEDSNMWDFSKYYNEVLCHIF